MAKPKKELQLLPISVALQGITDALAKSNGIVSDSRQHSVESHLRSVIRLCGFKPRETADKKASMVELAEQADTCLKHAELTEARAHEIQLHLHSVHSNLAADAVLREMPALKEIPPVVALLILGLFLWLAPAAQAQSNPEPFNITNVINPAVNLISFPTNAVSTNLTVTGYSTNGATITTNGFYPGASTGKPVETRNYAWTGFYFSGLTTASNALGTLVFQFVRAKSYSPPNYTTNGSDFETTPSFTATIPIPLGTNVPVTWMTNLDESYTKCATYIGVYSITNTTTGTASTTNCAAGLVKKILPLALSGGVF